LLVRKERTYILGQSKLAAQIRLRFVSEGFEARVFPDLAELLAHMETQQPDLVLHTEYAAGGDGAEFCIRAREKTDAIILLMGEGLSDMDISSALGLGADVCFSDPPGLSVLIAQIHALFRRSKLSIRKGEEERKQGYLIDSPRLKIDVGSRTVIIDYQPIALTAREFDILALLAGHPNQVFYTKQIFQSVWDADSILSGDDRPVCVHISNLRKKIEPDPQHPCIIITLRGVGYKFQPPQ
jgi:DNA-binding response OmpR family regulator